MKPYRVVARLKNNRLWRAIQAVFPEARTQSAAARCLGISPQDIGQLLNMTQWPYSERDGQWWPLAIKIATALKETPEYLFDGALYGQTPKSIDVEIDRPALVATGLLAFPVTPDVVYDAKEARAACDAALATLSAPEEYVLRETFGLSADGSEDDGRSLTDLANEVGFSKTRIAQIRDRALRKLRHPTRAKKIRDYLITT